MADQQLIPAGSTIELPYHFNSKGEPVKITIQQDATSDELESWLDENYPRDAAAVAREMVKSPIPVSKDEFESVMQEANSRQTIQSDRAGVGVVPFITQLSPVLEEAGKEFVGGVAELLGEQGLSAGTGYLLEGRYSEALKQSALGLARTIEGVAQGTEKLWDLAKLVASQIPLYTGADSGNRDYDMYVALKDIQQKDEARKAGQTILFGQNTDVGDSARKIANAVDLTVMLPFLGKALGTGMSAAGRATAEQALKSMAEESAAGVLRQGLGRTMEATGQAVGAGLSKAEQLAEAMKAGMAVKGAAAVGAAYELSQGNPLTATALGLGALGLSKAIPSTLRLGSKVLEATGKTLALDSSSIAARELISQMGKSASEDAATRFALQLRPPDSVARTIGSFVDAGLNGAAFGAGASYLEATADPFNSANDIVQRTLLGGATGTALGIGVHAGLGGGIGNFGAEARDRNYVRNLAHDIVSRPDEVSVNVHGFEVTANDKQNRINVLINSGLSIEDKARIQAILRSAEAAGHQVLFVNNDTKLPDSVGGSGADMGKGVRVVNGEEGRSTILINSDKITAPSAIEEVTHALMGDQMAKESLQNLINLKGSIGGAIDVLRPLAERYQAALASTNPTAANKFKKNFEVASNPNVPIDQRTNALLDLAHEYFAMGAAEILKGNSPESLEVGLGQSVWTRMSESALAGMGMNPSQASVDPITGFFWKDGKVINDPVLQGVVDNLKTSIRQGKNLQSKQKPKTAAERVSAERRATGYEPGDIGPAGERIVGFQVGPRYEDIIIDPNTGQERVTTGEEKDAIHEGVFKQVSKIKGAQVVEEGKYIDGVYAGPVKPTAYKSRQPKGAPETPIVYIDQSLNPSELLSLFSAKDHRGNLVISPEKRSAIDLVNSAIDTGNILNLDVDVNLNKRKDAGREYAARVDKQVLVLGIQQHPDSGPLAVTYDLSLLNNILNHERGLVPSVDAALKDFKINTLEDAVPYLKAYLENFSRPKSLPGAEVLQLVAPEGTKPQSAVILRDVFHLAGGLTQRKALGEKLVNQPYAESVQKLPPYAAEATTPTGETFKSKLNRDQSVFNWHRLDEIHNASIYQQNGSPVSISVDKSNMVNRYRANFSPDTTARETLGDSTVITDPESKQRIIVKPSGKADLFDAAGNKTTYRSEQDAINASNKALAKQTAQFSPDTGEGYRRLSEAERKKLEAVLNYRDIKNGTAFKELHAAETELLRHRADEVGGDLPKWVQSKELRSDIERKVSSEIRRRQKFAQKIREESQAWKEAGNPSVFDPEDFQTKTGKKGRAERPQMSRAELEAVTEAAGFVPSAGKPAEVRPPSVVKPGTTLKSLQDLTGLMQYAPETAQVKPVEIVAQPTSRPVAVDLISEKKKPFRATAIKTEGIQGFLKELAGSKSDIYEQAIGFKPSETPSVYTDVRQRVPESTPPPKETKVEGVATAADDPKIPATHIIQFTPSGNFKVWSIGRQAPDAITKSYAEAINKARQKSLQEKPVRAKPRARMVPVKN